MKKKISVGIISVLFIIFILYSTKGDVDLCGEISINDLVLTNRYCLGLTQPSIFEKFRMDVNSDFKIDLNDIYLINQKVMQKYKNI